MSKLVVQSIEGPDDNANRFPDGLSVTGITTLASSGGITTTGGVLFVGAGASVGGRLEVSGITSVGNLVSSGIITADFYYGSGANLTGTGIAGVNTTGFSTFKDVKHAGITTCVGIVSCSDVVSTGIITAKAFIPTEGHLSNRNWIFNGSMQIAQRATSTTSTGYASLDRWHINWGGTDESPTIAQVTLTSSDAGPWAKGFRNALQITNGNQTGGAGAGDDVTIQQKIEAQNVANSGWDYTNTSSYITLQFWVKSSIAQNFYGRIASNDGTAKSYPFQTGSLSANTWTKVTKTIPGHADLQFDNNSGTGFIFILLPFLGTDKTDSGVSLDTWATYDSAERTPNSTSTWYTTNDSTFALTGVQIEVGLVPTPFEHREFGNELLRCQRYYEKSYPYTVAPGTSGDNGRRLRRVCASATSQVVFIEEIYKVTKRTTPTLTTYSSDGTSGEMFLCNYGSTSLHVTATVYGNCDVGFEVSGSGTANGAAVFWQANAEL